MAAAVFAAAVFMYNKTMKKLCIFDLDGTLLYTLDSLATPTNRVLAHFGLPPQPTEAYKTFVGDGLKNEMKRALIASGDQQASFLDEAFPMVKKLFDADPLYHVVPYDGMPETLNALKEQGIKLAVFSNKPHNAAIEVVENMFGKGVFDCIQGQTDDTPIKPDPTGALNIINKLGVRAEECCYFGDSNTDMMTGKNAGFMTVGVSWGYRSVEELSEYGADRIIDHPSDILSLL